MEGNTPRMRTIHEVSEETGLSYNHVRTLCKNDKVVFIKAGNKFLINFDKFIDYLNSGMVYKKIS